jgi:SAM-dependent methyltransferase
MTKCRAQDQAKEQAKEQVRTMSRYRYGWLCLLALAGGGWGTAPAAESEPTKLNSKLDVWYVATPHEVVDRMLDVAKVRTGDVVYDLGCGDGRMVIAAAKKFGTRGVGIDLDPARIREARANAKAQGVEQLVTFRVADLFKTDLREATVVMLYLLPEVNRRLKPKLFTELSPGARVVSHDFDMGKDWPPDRSVNLGSDGIYMWVMPPLAERLAAPQ